MTYITTMVNDLSEEFVEANILNISDNTKYLRDDYELTEDEHNAVMERIDAHLKKVLWSMKAPPKPCKSNITTMVDYLTEEFELLADWGLGEDERTATMERIEAYLTETFRSVKDHTQE